MQIWQEKCRLENHFNLEHFSAMSPEQSENYRFTTVHHGKM